MNFIVRNRVIACVFILVVTVLCLVLLELGYGQVQIPLTEVMTNLFSRDTESVSSRILHEIRLPRALTAILSGAALGIAGVLMQTLFRNPMADAWSMGLTAGGQLGVAMIVAGAAFAGPAAIGFIRVFEGVSITLGAVAGVGVLALVMIALARRVSHITLLVIGLMLGFTVQGLVSVIMHFANRVGGRVFSGWNDGSFASVTSADLPMLGLPIVAGILLALVNAKPLTSLLLGESYASSMGTDVTLLRRVTLTATILLVAPVTAYCGPVTFVGLIVPHFARALAGTGKILPLIPLAGLCGAVLTLAADLVVHLPWEQHFLHLNAVLGIIGAPVVVMLLLFSPVMRGQR